MAGKPAKILGSKSDVLLIRDWGLWVGPVSEKRPRDFCAVLANGIGQSISCQSLTVKRTCIACGIRQPDGKKLAINEC